MTAVGAGLPNPVRQASAWRRPPRSAPWGRSPSSGRSLAILGVLFFFYVYYVAGAALASILGAGLWGAWSGINWPAAVPFLVVCALGVGYGLAVIATSGRPRARLVMRDWGLGSSQPAKVWLGLAYVLPLAASVVGERIRFAAPLAGTAPSQLSWLVGWAGPVAFAVCLILARVSSVRAVKRAIVDGRAASFTLSDDHAWWWDGDAWAAVSIAAPTGALLSPDANYWWTGQDWMPLPPRR